MRIPARSARGESRPGGRAPPSEGRALTGGCSLARQRDAIRARVDNPGGGELDPGAAPGAFGGGAAPVWAQPRRRRGAPERAPLQVR